jgi:Tol biopolymer transport system component
VLDPSLVPALEGRSQAFPRWSPDRRRLAFVAGGELFVADADGANVRSLASSVHRSPPSWRPDGQSLVFLAGNVVQEVTMAGELRPAAGFSPWQYNVEPVVLPSGGLVYQGYCNEEACASHGGTFGLPGCEDGAAIYGHGFAFAKDGASLLYAQQADPRAWSPFDFEQRGAVGKCEACACTTVLSMGDAWLPRWSPDDRGFVFLRGDRQMWIVREGAEPTLLFEGAGPLTGLDW